MNFYIKQWPDNSATLMTENNTALWTFASVEEAQTACHDWYQLQDLDRMVAEASMQDPSCSNCQLI